MNRRAFLQRCVELGATLPFFSFLLACEEGQGQRYADFDVNFGGRVIVVGAGAAGLAAGYMLDRYDIDFEILEAMPRIGGRVKRGDTLAEVPIDLGAEWIHSDPGILARLIDDPSVEGSVDVVPYSPDTISVYRNDALRPLNVGGNYYAEYKFHRTTWFDFLERYIASSIIDRVRLHTPITAVEHDETGVRVTDAQGGLHTADRVLMTVPQKVHQDRRIAFSPPWPDEKLRALDALSIPDGLKVFFEFTERFYPDLTAVGSFLGEGGSEKLFYDAMFRKDSDRHVLGLFHVGPGAADYVRLGDDETLVQRLLGELDAMFDGKATPRFVRAVVEDWSANPFIRAAYPTDVGGDTPTTLATLRRPIDGRLYFAGAGVDYENQSTVHGAMQSAYAAVERILGDTPPAG